MRLKPALDHGEDDDSDYMKIYHGGSAAIMKPEIRASAYNKDFGPGFYCTEMQQQAERWARRFHTPVVSVFEYIKDDFINILEFMEMTDAWLDFIAACRNGEPYGFDIVSGAMANDQVWNYIADYIAGILTREQFWVLAKFKYPTHQIAFCSRRSMECLSYLESYEVRS